jgi:hypothetical protein
VEPLAVGRNTFLARVNLPKTHCYKSHAERNRTHCPQVTRTRRGERERERQQRTGRLVSLQWWWGFNVGDRPARPGYLGPTAPAGFSLLLPSQAGPRGPAHPTDRLLVCCTNRARARPRRGESNQGAGRSRSRSSPHGGAAEQAGAAGGAAGEGGRGGVPDGAGGRRRRAARQPGARRHQARAGGLQGARLRRQDQELHHRRGGGGAGGHSHLMGQHRHAHQALPGM